MVLPVFYMPVSRVTDIDNYAIEDLKAIARRQDIDRGVRADDEYFRSTGENRISRVVPPDVVVPLTPSEEIDESRLEEITIPMLAFKRRQKELEEREMAEALAICRKRVRRSVALLELDF